MATEVSKDESPASQASSFVSSLLELLKGDTEEYFSEPGGLQMSARGSIRRVPKDLREGNEEKFTPIAFSIGPIHASDPQLLLSRKVKKYLCRSYIDFFSNIEDCYKELAEKEKEARECYDNDEVKHLESNEFLQMMFIDGCFILQLLLDKDLVYVPKVHEDIHVEFAWRDLLLLENQIPFVVLLVLFRHSEGKIRAGTFMSPTKTLVSLLADSVQNVLLMPGVQIDFDQLNKGSFSHLLDLAWQIMFPEGNYRDHFISVVHPEDLCYAKSVSELALYGIKCKNNVNGIKPFFRFKIRSWYFQSSKQSQPPAPLGVEYKDGALELPWMLLDYFSTTLYWNLLAYEQQPDFKKIRFFQSFIVFMSTLIKTENDFKLVEREHIMDSAGGIDSSTPTIPMLFRDLSKNIRNAPDTGYMKIIKYMNDDCKRCIPSFRAYLGRNYYDARWDVLQSILLFILTVTQTIYAVLSYKQKGP